MALWRCEVSYGVPNAGNTIYEVHLNGQGHIKDRLPRTFRDLVFCTGEFKEEFVGLAGFMRHEKWQFTGSEISSAQRGVATVA